MSTANIAALADRTVTLYRRTAYVVDAATAAASMTVARQPVRGSVLRAEVSGGTTGSGTVTVTGTVEGVAGTTEVLTFTANGTRSGSKVFTAVSAVATSGLADEATKPTVGVLAVDVGGAPQAQDTSLAANVPAVVKRSSGRWPVRDAGSEAEQRTTFLVDRSDVWTPRKADALVDDGTSERWLVEDARGVGGAYYASHYELDCRRV